MIRAVALAGPTACQKSKFSRALAAALGGEIISADSGAVYREMDIGTAKPSIALRAAIPHHLVDIRAPDETFNAGMFCRLAAQAAQEIRARNATPLFIGGAMMYFHSLTRGLRDIPEISEDIRDSVRTEMQKHGAMEMHRRLAQTDPQSAQQILATDSQRIARALEIAMQTRRAPSSFFAEQNRPPPLRLSFVVLMPEDRALLQNAIAARLQKMWADGLVDETESVIRKYDLRSESPPLRMAGYRQAAAFLRGEYGAQEMRERAMHATRQLAKRQMTWLRNWNIPATVVNPFALDAEEKILVAMRDALN